MSKNVLSRRSFLQMAVVGSSCLLLFPQCTNHSTRVIWRFFTEKEASLVDALVEQIIPTNEWQGAKDAGVTNFIDKQLVSTYIRFQEKYRNGIAAVEASCKILYQKKFEELSWGVQTVFLKKMETGELSNLQKEDYPDRQGEQIWTEGFDKIFFSLIREHTMQGYYGSPKHGGNRNYVSYKMIGLDYPHIIGQNRYMS